MSDERTAILDAAVAEFAEVGLVDATLSSIAQRAGLAPGVARALFVDKPNLLRAVMTETTHPMVSAISIAVENIDDPKELMREALRLFDQWLLDHPDIVRVILRCTLDGPEALGLLYQQALLPSEFYEHLQRTIDGGRLRCKDLFVLSTLIDSLILFPHMIRSALVVMRPEQSAEVTIEDRFEAMIDLFENGLYER